MTRKEFMSLWTTLKEKRAFSEEEEFIIFTNILSGSGAITYRLLESLFENYNTSWTKLISQALESEAKKNTTLNLRVGIFTNVLSSEEISLHLLQHLLKSKGITNYEFRKVTK